MIRNDFDITPYEQLNGASIDRQHQIIDAIKRNLREDPLKWIILSGPPDAGKTYIMNAIREGIIWDQSHFVIAPRVFDLRIWWDNRVAEKMGQTDRVLPQVSEVSSFTIMTIDAYNRKERRNEAIQFYYERFTAHFFIDEIDTEWQNMENFAADFQTLINRAYASPNVQLVLAMNKSLAELEKLYGTHLTRRLYERGLIIEYDKPVPSAAEDSVKWRAEKQRAKINAEIDAAIGQV